jgi:hypothetical protein
VHRISAVLSRLLGIGLIGASQVLLAADRGETIFRIIYAISFAC